MCLRWPLPRPRRVLPLTPPDPSATFVGTMSNRTAENPGALTRRRFLRDSIAGATAAAALGAGGAAEATQAQTSAPAAAAIKIPPEFAAASSAAVSTMAFPMTGAQVFARACKEEGVAA